MAAKPKFSSTPASVIYSQSWPVPTANLSYSQRYPAKANSNSQKKGINSPWICKPKQRITRPQKVASPIHKPYSWASSMLSNNYPGWLEKDGQVMLDEYLNSIGQKTVHDILHSIVDMAKEFKITLQMFKTLTEQVKEVDEQLNSGRKPYSFKHYFNNRKSSCTRTRTRNYTPEIPMTNEAYQPCTNLGLKREQPRPHSQYEVYRKTDKPSSIKTSKSRREIWPLSNTDKPKTRNRQAQLEASGDENYHENQRSRFQNDDYRSGTNFDGGDTQWSSCLEFSDEGNGIGLGYIDPVPQYWEERKLDELELEFSSDKNGGDPFMVRYLHLRRLEIETVEQEKRNRKIEENCEPSLDCGPSGNAVTNKGKKSTSKKQSAKMNELKGAKLENVEKNPRRVMKKSSQSASSLHDFEKYCDQKGGQVSTKGSKESRTSKDKKQTGRTECKSAKGKKRVQSCKGTPVSSSLVYDILELATSFDPPGKERINSNSRPVTAKSAKVKGMLPGKTWTSQRRFSLTVGQSLQSLPSDSSDPVISKSRTSSAKSAKKSSKRKYAKRCRSSKI